LRVFSRLVEPCPLLLVDVVAPIDAPWTETFDDLVTLRRDHPRIVRPLDPE
jgi:hypothetical protein